MLSDLFTVNTYDDHQRTVNVHDDLFIVNSQHLRHSKLTVYCTPGSYKPEAIMLTPEHRMEDDDECDSSASAAGVATESGQIGATPGKPAGAAATAATLHHPYQGTVPVQQHLTIQAQRAQRWQRQQFMKLKWKFRLRSRGSEAAFSQAGGLR